VAPPDPDLAATLWDRHADQVYAYARRRVGVAHAPDVVAEVFAAVVAHPERVPDEALPWLYRTTWNMIANTWRADARRQALRANLSSSVAADPADVVVPRAMFVDALLGLSEQDRDALLLTAWEGLDAREAAAASGCSTATFSVRLHRARRRLERALADAAVEAPTEEMR
jgi:RNA polymerase sigma-70 factor, ECF subfamily